MIIFNLIFQTSCVFASEWDLYDTYRRLSYEDEEAGKCIICFIKKRYENVIESLPFTQVYMYTSCDN